MSAPQPDPPHASSSARVALPTPGPSVVLWQRKAQPCSRSRSRPQGHGQFQFELAWRRVCCLLCGRPVCAQRCLSGALGIGAAAVVLFVSSPSLSVAPSPRSLQQPSPAGASHHLPPSHPPSPLQTPTSHHPPPAPSRILASSAHRILASLVAPAHSCILRRLLTRSSAARRLPNCRHAASAPVARPKVNPSKPPRPGRRVFVSALPGCAADWPRPAAPSALSTSGLPPPSGPPKAPKPQSPKGPLRFRAPLDWHKHKHRFPRTRPACCASASAQRPLHPSLAHPPTTPPDIPPPPACSSARPPLCSRPPFILAAPTAHCPLPTALPPCCARRPRPWPP